MGFMDAHVHLGTRYTSDLGVSTILEEMDKQGIEKVFCMAIDSAPEDCNEKVMEAISGHEDRLIPFCWVNPWDAKALDKLKYGIEQMGMKGLKIHPVQDGFPADRAYLLDPLFEVIDHYGLHAIVHCTSDAPYSSPLQLEKTAKRWPNVTIQMAHMGGCWLSNEAIRVALRNDNIYLDSATVSLSAVTRAAKALPDRLLMATDVPFYAFEMEKLKMKLVAQDDTELFEKISYKNMARLIAERGLV